ncbi:MAG: Hsp20/alpha crystallin family protein [Desulfobaccales bacterium]
MHRLIKIRIIRDFEQMEEHWRCQPDAWLGFTRPHLHFRPAADFYETAQGLLLRLEVAGIKPESLCLSLTGQELVVAGGRQPPPPEGIRRFIHLEMGFGAFERCFLLPIPVDLEGVRAHYRDGILEVHLPRKAPQIRKIPVKQADPE